MSDNFFEIQNGNFTASEKNKVNDVNLTIKELVKEKENIVLYGQNINAGSCLSGLTRGLADNTRGLTLNTPNAENTLVGVGFGLMLKGVNSIFFMKF